MITQIKVLSFKQSKWFISREMNRKVADDLY